MEVVQMVTTVFWVESPSVLWIRSHFFWEILDAKRYLTLREEFAFLPQIVLAAQRASNIICEHKGHYFFNLYFQVQDYCRCH